MFSGQGPAGGAEDGQQQPASAGSSAGSPLGASCNTVVVGQAMTAPATQQAAGGAAAAPGLLPVPANPVQQLQFHAVLQHQAAIMQNPGTYPAAAQMYQQAMLQTGVLPSQPSGTLTYSGSLATGNAPVPAPGPAPVLGKRGKTQEEIEEQTERIKKRRRESAQRRCAPGGAAAPAPPLCGWWGAGGTVRACSRRLPLVDAPSICVAAANAARHAAAAAAPSACCCRAPRLAPPGYLCCRTRRRICRKSCPSALPHAPPAAASARTHT